jgi:exopolysaccharide biosynthesis polyprenyl glycosylphosphotransferase
MPAASLSLVGALHLADLGPAADISLIALGAWSAIIGLGVFTGHYFLTHYMVRCGRKCRIVLDLTPGERLAVVDEIEQQGLIHSIAFLSREELKEYSQRGAESEIDFVLVSRKTARDFDNDGLLILAHLAGVTIYEYREMLARLSGRVAPESMELWSFLQGATPHTPLLRALLASKLVFEPLAAMLLGLILSPVMLLVALLIKATSPGPVFYRQVRTGYLGRNFMLVKFRSMATDAEARGVQWSSSNDPRVTPLGRILRATRLDELPQLWNVMRGEMSFIGPRPERPEIYKQLEKQIPHFSLRLLIRPGVTGWAQVSSGYAASVDECRIKLEHDLYYIQHISPRLDLVILCRTIQVAIFGDRAARREGVVSAAPAVLKSS